MADDQPSIASAVVLPETQESLPRPASPPNGIKRRQSSVSEQDGKRRRLSTEGYNESRRDSTSNAAAPDRGVERRRSDKHDIDAVERKRGKRLFGAMLGALSQGSSTTAQKRRADIEKKQQAKLKLQAEELDQKKRQRLDEIMASRRKEQKKFDEESMRIRHSNLLDMAHFLYTKTEPRLYYKPWELTLEEEDRINTQVEEAQAKIDQELDDFERQREEERKQEGSSKEDMDIDKEPPRTTTPVGSVPSGDALEVPVKQNGTTDHSASLSNNHTPNENGEREEANVAVNGEEGKGDEVQPSNETMTAGEGGREAMDENGEVILEAAEDTVIF
ncbi:hypothetical protein K432DRAFT_361627 [Lepidopterella palustris CBS 459.81]|uniref:Pinin/SDK/MemA protein domain-containing protein n=1 Tax=Lepidopterella palustris CBS 459.81 TaxID=1314670 RepID=A0A8E2E1V7_9PEZI|nr:hypothetical protein K432DRAFT_361627 [Lepidopterella palustris CBS 459.81]